MNIERVMKEVAEQYAEMHPWMQKISVCVDVLRANNSTSTLEITKIRKRIARIEDKLNIKEGD